MISPLISAFPLKLTPDVSRLADVRFILGHSLRCRVVRRVCRRVAALHLGAPLVVRCRRPWPLASRQSAVLFTDAQQSCHLLGLLLSHLRFESDVGNQLITFFDEAIIMH